MTRAVNKWIYVQNIYLLVCTVDIWNAYKFNSKTHPFSTKQISINSLKREVDGGGNYDMDGGKPSH